MTDSRRKVLRQFMGVKPQSRELIRNTAYTPPQPSRNPLDVADRSYKKGGPLGRLPYHSMLSFIPGTPYMRDRFRRRQP